MKIELVLQLIGVGFCIMLSISVVLLAIDMVIKIYDNNKILNKLEDKFLEEKDE